MLRLIRSVFGLKNDEPDLTPTKKSTVLRLQQTCIRTAVDHEVGKTRVRIVKK